MMGEPFDKLRAGPKVPAHYRCLAAFAALAAVACARSFSAQAVNAANVASVSVKPWPAAIILMLRFSFSDRRTCSRFLSVVAALSFILV